MNYKYTALEFTNKIQAVIPWVLLLGCDGTTGSESLITVGVDLALILFLTVFEADYRNNRKFLPALAIASGCAFLTVCLCAVELVLFSKNNKLLGAIALYGIPNTLLTLTGLLFGLAWFSAGVDIFARPRDKKTDGTPDL